MRELYIIHMWQLWSVGILVASAALSEDAVINTLRPPFWHMLISCHTLAEPTDSPV